MRLACRESSVNRFRLTKREDLGDLTSVGSEFTGIPGSRSCHIYWISTLSIYYLRAARVTF